MKITEEKGALIFFPEGRIDSSNASFFEKELMQALDDHPGMEPARGRPLYMLLRCPERRAYVPAHPR